MWLHRVVHRTPERVARRRYGNGRNPISIIVPCHRVIGSTGRLVGYGNGLDRKQILLDLERRAVGAEPQLSLL